MRSATLIAAALGSLSLTMPAAAQQRSWQGRGTAPTAPAAMLLQRAMPPVARLNPPQGSTWKPQPGATRPPGWQPGRPGGWKPGAPGHWQPGRPGWKPGAPRPGWRWGEKVRGRWHAGWRAPGGWGAYRRPVRGWVLPSYWVTGGFWINDWSYWGLSSPPHGYSWVRYYDDAVLVDRGGRVWDSVSGLDWDRDADRYDDRYEDDRYHAEGEEGYPGPGADYDPPEYHDDDYVYRGGDLPPPHVAPAVPLRCVANCYGASGYAHGAGGYYYGGPVTTTVVIQSAPVVTTTTVTEEVVTYGGGTKVVRRVPTKRLYRAPARVKGKTCHCR